MANRKFMKLNQFPSSIQSPASSPDDYNTFLFTDIFLQFDNEWLFFIPNLFHSLISAISNFFHSILSWLYVIPNFFHSLLSSIANLFHSLFSFIPNLFHSLNSAITNLFHSLVSWLSVIPNLFTNLFHSLLSWLSVIPDSFHSLVSEITNLFHSLVHQTTNLFHSLVSRLSTIPDLFHSLVYQSTNLFHSLVYQSTNLFHSLVYQSTNLFHSFLSWLSEIPDLFHTFLHKITNLFHSLLAKFDEACPPETRAHILEVARPFVIPVLGVILLCFFLYYCWTAISACMTLLANVVKKLISLIGGLFRLLKDICIKVFNICSSCFTESSIKMMKAPGTAGKFLIGRASFESNPSAYFRNLRPGKVPLLCSCWDCN